jgi:hypothetical protein
MMTRKLPLILLLMAAIVFVSVAPVKSQPAPQPTFDLTTSSICTCSGTAVYKFHIENPTGNAYNAISVTIPAGYAINPAYMTTTPGIVVATGVAGDVNPRTTDHAIDIKTTGTSGIFELFQDGQSVYLTGMLTPPTPTSQGKFNSLFAGIGPNLWAEVSFVPGFLTNPCVEGNYVWAPNTASLVVGAVIMEPRPGYTNEVRIQACGTVGGVVMPTNTLAILTPYLALAGLIAAVSAVVAVERRRD